MRRLARISQRCAPAAIAGSLLAVISNAALAGGFGIEQSAYYQGMSYAGAAAGGESLAAIAWNPATAYVRRQRLADGGHRFRCF